MDSSCRLKVSKPKSKRFKPEPRWNHTKPLLSFNDNIIDSDKTHKIIIILHNRILAPKMSWFRAHDIVTITGYIFLFLSKPRQKCILDNEIIEKTELMADRKFIYKPEVPTLFSDSSGRSWIQIEWAVWLLFDIICNLLSNTRYHCCFQRIRT